MPESVTFTDPSGQRRPIALDTFEVPGDLPDFRTALGQDSGARPALRGSRDAVQARRPRGCAAPCATDTLLHVALRGHMGTGKDHDLEHLAALRYASRTTAFPSRARCATSHSSVR